MTGLARHRRLARVLAGVTAVVTALALAGCGGDDAGGAGGGDLDAVGADALKDGKVTVEFWHSMKGANAEAIDKLVGAFNSSQDKVEVKPLFKGNYDETIAAYKQSVQRKSTPELVQIYDIGTRFMVDSKQIVPMHKFIDLDKFGVEDIEPNIASYYSLDGKLWSMPFNSSTPLLYMNKEAFAKAGLDATKPPTTLDELTTYAQKLTIKDAGGKVVQYGFNAAIYGWLLEQLLATAGKEYCDNGNGRDKHASKVLFDSPEAVKVAKWWQNLVANGWATNTGRKTDDSQAAFKSGTVAMHLESTSVLRGYVDAAKGKFTVMTAPYPKLDAASPGGTIIGGASMWINGVGHSDAEKRGAWEFVKFALSPQQQASWHVGTGYVPVNKKALDLPEDKQWIAQYPQFTSAVDQLHANKPSLATSGCILGVMPESRKASEDGLEQTILGSKPAEQAMADAAKAIKPEIEKYNKSVQ